MSAYRDKPTCEVCGKPIGRPGVDGVPHIGKKWVHWPCMAEWDRRWRVCSETADLPKPNKSPEPGVQPGDLF